MDYDMGFRDYSPGLNRFLTRDMYNGALSDLRLGSDPWTGNDGGVGWLLDATDLGFLRRLQQASEDDLLEFLEAADSDDAKIINDPGLSGSIVAFNCGMGDGVYPVWIGRDAEGHPVSIVIDLELLSHSLGMIE